MLVQKLQDEDKVLFEAIEAYKSGDKEKATLIYESTKKYTYRIIYQHVGRFKNQSVVTGDENTITEDVMQELYLDFFNNIEKFRNEDPKSIYKWISIVSNRMVLKYVDKNKMEVLQYGKDEDFREENDIWDSTTMTDSDMESNHEAIPEEALEDKEFQELIMGFIQSLPEAQAQTVLLHFHGGMKYQEIADEMGVSLITVKTRMKKAKDSLEEIITKYENKTGTKLHSVSVLPLLWVLYRLFAKETKVPIAVDTAVKSGLAASTGAVVSGVSGVATVGTATATKIIGTKAVIAILSTTVVIGGGAYAGSRIIGPKQETSIEKELLQETEKSEKEDLNDKKKKEEVDEKASSEDEKDTVTDNKNTEEKDSQDKKDADKETDGNDAKGDDTANDAEADGNTESNNQDSSSKDEGGTQTTTKGTKENPYRIGEKIVVTEDVVEQYANGTGDIYNFEITVTGYTPISELYAKAESEESMLYNIVKATVKITGNGADPGVQGPVILTLLRNDGGMGFSGHLFSDEGVGTIIDVKNNVEYRTGVHQQAMTVEANSIAEFLEIKYFTADGETHRIYVKLE